jgi:hypothetical protein
MKPRDNIRIYLFLVFAWVILVVMQHFSHLYLKNFDYLIYANDSLAPIPAIVLVVVFLVGLFIEKRDRRSRKQQLLFTKSCMFRVELRNLYTADFLALKSPPLTFSRIITASLVELRQMRKEAETVEYRSLEAMKPVITEYVKAEGAWRSFVNFARENGLDDIFQDMLYIMHFIGDVRTFKEINPEKPYIYEAARDAATMQKVVKLLGDGIRKYLDYVIELKEKQPDLLNQVVTDYELSAQARAS